MNILRTIKLDYNTSIAKTSISASLQPEELLEVHLIGNVILPLIITYAFLVA